MNEQLQKSLADIIASLTEASKQVGEVAKEQLPLLVQEYLRWGFWESCIYAAILISLAVFLAVVTVKAWKIEDEDAAALWLFPAGCTIASTVSSIFCAMDAVKITIAPRVYLLEQVKELIR